MNSNLSLSEILAQIGEIEKYVPKNSDYGIAPKKVQGTHMKSFVVIQLEVNIENDFEEVEKQIAKNTLQKRDTLIGSFKSDKLETHRGGSDDEAKTASTITPVERDKFYWNERFQQSIEKVAIHSEEIALRNQELDQLAKDFCKIAVPLVQKIIKGEQLNESSSKIGGVAGGQKLKAKHMFCKFSMDVKMSNSPTGATWLYGREKKNDELAMKSAESELRALNAIASCNIKYLHIPFTIVITTLGYRVLCTCNLPVDSSSLVYGSEDAGSSKPTFKSDEEFTDLVKLVCENLYLKKHKSLGGKEIFGPFDLEGHRGHDGRLYILDTARLLPPTGYLGGGHSTALYYHFRPEFLQKYKAFKGSSPLNSDALSNFNCDAEIDNQSIYMATSVLLYLVVKNLADGLKALLTKHQNDLTAAMHAEGVNIRYMGELYLKLSDPELKQIVALNLIARAFKLEVNQYFRDGHEAKKIVSESEFKSAVVNHLNWLVGNSSDSQSYWNGPLKKRIESKFFSKPDPKFEDLKNNARSWILPSKRSELLHEICKNMGIKLKSSAFESGEISEDQIEQLPCKIKTINIKPLLSELESAEGRDKLFIKLKEFYENLKERQQKYQSPRLPYTLAHLGDLYASEMQSGGEATLIQAEQYYIEAFNEMKKIVKLPDPSNPAHATLHSGESMQRDEAQKQLHASNILEKLADLYAKLNEFDLVESICARVYELKRKVLGEKHPHLASTLFRLGDAYRAKGKSIEAYQMYETALRVSQETFGNKHFEYARTLNNTLPFYLSRGDFGKARESLDAIYDILNLSNKKQTTEYAVALDNEGQLHLLEGQALLRAHPSDENGKKKIRDALKCFSESLTLKKEVLGVTHHSYAITLDHIGVCKLFLNEELDSVEAEFFKKAIQIFETEIGKDNPFLACSYNNASGVNWLRKSWEEAFSKLQRAVDISNQRGLRNTQEITENANLVQSRSEFQPSVFKFCRHDSYVGVTNKGFQIDFLPEEILAELGVNKLEYPKVIDLTTAQDILETIAKDINNKMQQFSAEPAPMNSSNHRGANDSTRSSTASHEEITTNWILGEIQNILIKNVMSKAGNFNHERKTVLIDSTDPDIKRDEKGHAMFVSHNLPSLNVRKKKEVATGELLNAGEYVIVPHLRKIFSTEGTRGGSDPEVKKKSSKTAAVASNIITPENKKVIMEKLKEAAKITKSDES